MESPRQRVLYLAHGLNAVSCRFRIFQYLPSLRQMGIDVDVADWHAPIRRRGRILQSAAACDAVCVHRALLSAPEYQWLRRAVTDYVFDFDDAIMFRDSSRRRFDSWQRRRRFARMVRGARIVIAGNTYLAGLARRYNPEVAIVPTPVDGDAFPAPRPAWDQE